MIEVMRQWLVGVTCAALIAAAAEGLTPKGTVKQVGRLVCALVLLCAVLRPIFSFHGVDVPGGFAEIQAQQKMQTEQLLQGSEALLKTHIERESEAYILDKASQLGVCCEVRVECAPGEAGVWIPQTVYVTGALTGEEKEKLTAAIEALFDIAPERQIYTRGE